MLRAQGVKWPWAESTCIIVIECECEERKKKKEKDTFIILHLSALIFLYTFSIEEKKGEVNTDHFYFCIIHNANGLNYISS